MSTTVLNDTTVLDNLNDNAIIREKSVAIYIC